LLLSFLVPAIVHKYNEENRELLIRDGLKTQPIVPIEEQELTIA